MLQTAVCSTPTAEGQGPRYSRIIAGCSPGVVFDLLQEFAVAPQQLYGVRVPVFGGREVHFIPASLNGFELAVAPQQFHGVGVPVFVWTQYKPF